MSVGVNPEAADQMILRWEQAMRTREDMIWRLDQRLMDLEKQVTRRREDLGSGRKS